MIANTDCKRYDAFFGKETFMNRIRDEIDRELSGLTFEKIEKGARGELPEKRKEKKMKFNKKIITGIAAAAALATVTVTAGAASDWNYGKLIRGFFPHSAEASGSDLDGYMQEVAAAQNTFTEVEASFDGAIYDGNCLVISVSFRKKDGTPFEDGRYGMDSACSWQQSGGGVRSIGLQEDGSLGGFIMLGDVSDVRNEGSVWVEVSNLTLYSDDLSEKELIDGGAISAEFVPEWCRESRCFTLYDEKGRVVTADVTPISIRFRSPKGLPVDDIPRPVISGKDGVLIGKEDCHTITGGLLPQSDDEYQLFTFAKPIDINEITRIECGGFSYDDHSTSGASAVELLDPLMQNAEITSTFTNYNARFDGIIYDGKVLMASVNLAAKDGTPFDPSHDYSGAFRTEGIGLNSGSEWWRVNEDGTLQAYSEFEIREISEETEITITYHYVLCDSDMLKLQPADELPPEEVLDPGSITAKLKLKKCGIEKDVELKDGNGNVIQAHITPISIELIYTEEFIGGRDIVDWEIPKDSVIYGKNGEVLIGMFDYSGGGGDASGRSKGVPFYLGIFSRIIDVDEIAGVACGDFSYGEIRE